MWRALFLAVGFFVMVLGVECLGVEKVSLKLHDDPSPSFSPFDLEPKEGIPRSFPLPRGLLGVCWPPER